MKILSKKRKHTKTERVSSTPLREFRDTMLHPASFAAFRGYLEKACGCSCTLLDDESVFVRFPEGTMEEEDARGSTTWRKETLVRLPNRVKLIKRVYPPTREGEKTLAALVLPKGAVEKNPYRVMHPVEGRRGST